MAQTGFSCIFLTLALLSSVCSQSLTEKEQKDIKEINQGIEKFSITLLLRTALESEGENFVESPISVWSMLSVLAEGAQGATLNELEFHLGHPKNDLQKVRDGFKVIAKALQVNTSTVQLEMANNIFLDSSKQIKQDYARLARDYYFTEIKQLDLTDVNASKVMNNMISNFTNGKIMEIVTIDDLVNPQMIITNAIYFKGQWAISFDTSLTDIKPFYSDDNTKIVGSVNMMTTTASFKYVNMTKLQSEVIELPFGEENRLSMIILVPHYGVKLLDFFKKFENVYINEIFQEINNASRDKVEVHLPRFNINTDIIVNSLLYRMGIFDVFNPSYCDLGKISNDIYLSRVLHKAKIEVNENGVAAAKSKDQESDNVNTPLKVFSANKPFMYLIIEKMANLILLGGVYSKPELV